MVQDLFAKRRLISGRLSFRSVFANIAAATAILASGCQRSSGARGGFSVHPHPARANGEITIAAVGDILLDRGVAREMAAHGWAAPFRGTAGILRSADIATGNLECPLADRAEKVVKPFCFRARPASAAALTYAGLDVLNVANNHTMDCGRDGLLETLSTLKGRGLRWCGGCDDEAEAEAPTIVTVRGIRVGFLGFCEFIPEGVFLRADRPSIAFASEENVLRVVTAARRQCDVLVCEFHWGVEHTQWPTERQRRLARIAAGAGADLILGHHPHVLQGLEVIHSHGRRTLVIYSLGNFVFDQGLGLNRPEVATVILECRLGKGGIRSAGFVPARIIDCSPRSAKGADGGAIATRLAELSAGGGVRITGNEIQFR